VGIGSVGHLGMEVVKGRAGNFGAVHVPYNGNPAVMNALLAGQVQMALMPPGLALAQVKRGQAARHRRDRRAQRDGARRAAAGRRRREDAGPGGVDGARRPGRT
jgi:ABC-type amino acid transport substrate-binding protein